MSPQYSASLFVVLPTYSQSRRIIFCPSEERSTHPHAAGPGLFCDAPSKKMWQCFAPMGGGEGFLQSTSGRRPFRRAAGGASVELDLRATRDPPNKGLSSRWVSVQYPRTFANSAPSCRVSLSSTLRCSSSTHSRSLWRMYSCVILRGSLATVVTLYFWMPLRAPCR